MGVASCMTTSLRCPSDRGGTSAPRRGAGAKRTPFNGELQRRQRRAYGLFPSTFNGVIPGHVAASSYPLWRVKVLAPRYSQLPKCAVEAFTSSCTSCGCAQPTLRPPFWATISTPKTWCRTWARAPRACWWRAASRPRATSSRAPWPAPPPTPATAGTPPRSSWSGAPPRWASPPFSAAWTRAQQRRP